ncbi:myb/SANT-like DNA-binding domain-containing protein 3 [Leptinotarsa decemlineata]|uniref:myb/SANT-like DNA-binding domain-containing protein 3 n=1 Tax=Leptinotarsa decemlineata TaxID=7539 RepID=UPI003D30B0E4
MESSSGKRKRSQNYTKNDRSLLLNCVSKYKHVVESKKTDGVTWKEKVTAWNKITDLYNSENANQEYRPVESLKKLYDNIKRNIRKEVAEEKTSIRCTGGGSGITVNDPNKELALSIMNKTSVFGLDNSLDPDSNDCNVVEDPEQEEIIIEFDREIENEASEENDVNALNWGDYTKRHLKRPLNPKLVPKSKKPSKPA